MQCASASRTDAPLFVCLSSFYRPNSAAKPFPGWPVSQLPDTSLSAIAAARGAGEPVGWGLYVHVPFCARKCPYCDFTVAVLRERPEGPYIDALWQEFDARADAYKGPLRTVYFGGGTPGLLLPESVRRWGEGMRARDLYKHLEEFTVEFNPEHADDARLQAWADAGATRISLGAQALHDDALQRLGREHRAEDVARAVDAARRAGFRHVSIDIIFAVPGVAPERTAEDLRQAIALPGVDHVSLYELTVEPRTAFGVQRRAGLLPELPDDGVLQHWRALCDQLEGAGFERYEVSNFAVPGARAKHNASYWHGRPYLGLGVSAASLWVDDARGLVERRRNRLQLRGYLQDPLDGAELEALTPAEHLGELLCMGLRSSDGLDLEALEARFARTLSTVRAQLERWVSDALIERKDGRYRPRRAALEIADTLALTLLEALDEDDAESALA